LLLVKHFISLEKYLHFSGLVVIKEQWKVLVHTKALREVSTLRLPLMFFPLITKENSCVPLHFSSKFSTAALEN